MTKVFCATQQKIDSYTCLCAPNWTVHCCNNKSHIIILAANFAADKHALMKWLAKHIPEWMAVEIDNKGEYLFMFLGPAANSMQFSKALAKWEARVGYSWQSIPTTFMPTPSSHTRLKWFYPPGYPRPRSCPCLVAPEHSAFRLGL